MTESAFLGIAFRLMEEPMVTFRLVKCRVNIRVALWVGRASKVGHASNTLGLVGLVLP